MFECMDGTNSITIMIDENHISMDESYKKRWNIWMNVEHEWTFGW
jgi:hypothetical protein